VADDSKSIRVFDLSGDLIFQFGSYGSGPAEFERINQMGIGEGDTLWVGDGLRRRVVGFSMEGEYLASYELQGIPPFYGNWIIGFFENGDPVLQGLRLVRPAAPPQVGPLSPNFLEWYRYDRLAEDATLLSLAVWREEWAHEWMGGHAEGEVIFGARSSAAVGRHSLFVSHAQDQFVVECVDTAGSTTRGFGREVTPRAPTGAERESYIEWRMANAPPNADKAAWRRVFADLPVRESYPAMSGIMVDVSDHIWVRHGASPVSPEVDWSVFSPDGEWMGDLVLPGGLEPLQIGEGFLLGSVRGEFGVEMIVLHSLLKPPPG
jgi:hypothetical protein